MPEFYMVTNCPKHIFPDPPSPTPMVWRVVLDSPSDGAPQLLLSAVKQYRTKTPGIAPTSQVGQGQDY